MASKVVHASTEILVGTWYRARLSWQPHPGPASPPGRVKLVLAEHISGEFDLYHATCTSFDVAFVAPVDLGSVVWGAYVPSPATWALHGDLDEALLTTGVDFSTRYFDYQFSDVSCVGAGGKAND